MEREISFESLGCQSFSQYILNEEPSFRENVTEILTRFASYNTSIGYLQGMNSVAAFLSLQGLCNEEVFFVLKKITEVTLPVDFYSNVQSAVTFTKMLFLMLSHTHKALHAKMEELIGISGSEHSFLNDDVLTLMFAPFQWIICLFTSSGFSPELIAVIWDYFLLEGMTVIFKAALAIFDYLEPTLLPARSI